MIHPGVIASVLRRSAQIAVERPRTALWTTLALTCALFAVAVAGIVASSVDQWTAARPGSSASMVVYLGEGTTDARAQALVGELQALSGVERAELVPAAESARRLAASLGPDAALLQGTDLTALPASVEVTLAPGVRDVVAMSPTVRSLRGAPGVIDVVVEDPGEDRISGALVTVRAIAWSAAALFAGLALITVLAAVRVRLDRGRREIAVLELLGAGPSFLVVPTALAGAIQGAVAAVIATLLVAIGFAVYAGSITESLQGSLGIVELAVPGSLLILAFVGAGAMLGLVGGGLAGVSRVAR